MKLAQRPRGRDGESGERAASLPLRKWVPAAAAATLLALALSGGCNLMTGAGNIELGDGGNGTAASGGSGNTGNVGNGGSGNTGNVGNGGSGNTGNVGNGGSGNVGNGGNGGSGGPPPPQCQPACVAHQHCEMQTMTCQCDPGWTLQGGACVAVPPGDPTQRTQVEVCQKWHDGNTITTPDCLVANGQPCDAGYLQQGALVDTVARINMFRWLCGLGPSGDDAGMDASAQLCANLEAWYTWPPSGSPHNPQPADSQCWTQTGASTAGQSNIAWGSGHPAQAITQFMQDGGNETTMGHRRWILNPPLDPVGIGYWSGGGQYGDGMCLMVFGGGGQGPFPPWVAVPNQGITPIDYTQWTWTFHGSMGGVPAATITMLRVDDNAPLAVNVQQLSQGYGQDCISWTPSGWTPQAGMTYRVTVGGLTGGDVTYDVKPVTCN